MLKSNVIHRKAHGRRSADGRHSLLIRIAVTNRLMRMRLKVNPAPKLILVNFGLFICLALYNLWVMTKVVSPNGYWPGLLDIVMPVSIIFGLAGANVISIFQLWRKGNRLGSLIPFGTFLFAMIVCLLGEGYAGKLIAKGTPCSPESFVQGANKADLTQTARQALGKGFKEIYLSTVSEPMMRDKVTMIAGVTHMSVPDDLTATLRRYGFKDMNMDDVQDIVTFERLCSRERVSYIWAKNGLREPFLMPPEITKVDLENWEEVLSILRKRDPQSKMYDHLKKSLGASLLERIAQYRSADDLSTQEQDSIISALNQLVASALIENSQITFDTDPDTERFELRIFGIRADETFWEIALIKKLLSEGILIAAGDGKHLKIKVGLTAQERLQVEWAHVGLMNLLYGRLLKKKLYPFTGKLGDGWYFRRS